MRLWDWRSNLCSQPEFLECISLAVSANQIPAHLNNILRCDSRWKLCLSSSNEKFGQNYWLILALTVFNNHMLSQVISIICRCYSWSKSSKTIIYQVEIQSLAKTKEVWRSRVRKIVHGRTPFPYLSLATSEAKNKSDFHFIHATSGESWFAYNHISNLPDFLTK